MGRDRWFWKRGWFAGSLAILCLSVNEGALGRVVKLSAV
ncbi:MAG: hypothetical protein OJF47_002872 [Nitrospira sp.]|jgi:hypothetical protein|nr:MAG: hypothetical protein OJF47_002872 [Nitrospira sp.]